ncbi:MAG TPA: MarR family transcriptional regulator [Candidatus Acidoferrum sp.]|jgi:DNA-binding MarR family transcriptional regulator|nr:MarR family transcriptional regulator [Candidatus Acidoferrum sp.]
MVYFPLDSNRYNDYISTVPPRHKAASLPLENRVFLALLKAADAVSQEAEQLLRSKGLTGPQYNVLRILCGAEPAGLPCRGIGDRMISHDPDMTRLLDRMEKRRLIVRTRQTDDRRVVKTRITREGFELLKTLDHPVRELHKRQFRHLPAARLKALAQLLEEARTPHND